MHKYTAEEKQFIKDYVPGHSHKQIQEAFTARFGWEIAMNQVKAYIKNNKLNTGRTGRFEKNHTPFNKGQKGYYNPGSGKGWFKKGHTPKNHKPVGSERISKDGYIEIKVEEPNKWRLKHRVVWQEHNGEVPKGHIIIFRDGDKTNATIDNLMLIKRSIHAILNHTGLCEFNGELKDTAVCIAELKSSVSGAKKKLKG